MGISFANINQLPVPTWNQLKINSVSLDVAEDGLNSYSKEAKLTLPEKVQADRFFVEPESAKIPGSMKQNYDFVSKNHNSVFALTIPEGATPDSPVIIEYSLDKNNSLLNDYIYIKAEKGCEVTVIIKYGSNNCENAFHCGFTFLEAGENAKVKLIKVQTLSKKANHVDAVAVWSKDRAAADIILNELGSERTAASCNIVLKGEQSSGNLGGIYIGKNQEEMDLNYRIEFAAKETEGEITVRGTLADSSKKTLKSTLDFMTGASGSKGREEEIVLTLSDKAVNLSAPLLLCGEDDVEGRHATSTGRPDPGKLHYLMCRGFDRKEAERLLVEASFTPLLNKIEMPKIKQEIKEYIGASIHG
ncbi:iron-regulated ABC transporter permease protein SufD [Kineothrix alysoides]|uniref:Iron-regulated ABC transporter permease protein SufD n=1 Tax=Kineothrix alysoides TaxID=1469948 RepID=A0A4R1R514_9FIRM|nr:SufD family Fe-S cluster assembly protein [Kineothrix alysoides]TCL60362.1 iron-regulated ABC transporter permease protein SufD [Kineothrix alysoides]